MLFLGRPREREINRKRIRFSWTDIRGRSSLEPRSLTAPAFYESPWDNPIVQAYAHTDWGTNPDDVEDGQGGANAETVGQTALPLPDGGNLDGTQNVAVSSSVTSPIGDMSTQAIDISVAHSSNQSVYNNSSLDDVSPDPNSQTQTIAATMGNGLGYTIQDAGGPTVPVSGSITYQFSATFSGGQSPTHFGESASLSLATPDITITIGGLSPPGQDLVATDSNTGNVIFSDPNFEADNHSDSFQYTVPITDANMTGTVAYFSSFRTAAVGSYGAGESDAVSGEGFTWTFTMTVNS